MWEVLTELELLQVGNLVIISSSKGITIFQQNRGLYEQILFTACLFLTGCAATGGQFSEQFSKTGGAQLLIYRPSSIVGVVRSPGIEINGQETCDLASNSYILKNVSPGEYTIAAQLWDIPGTSRIRLNAKANHQYFVKVTFDGGKVMSGSLGGYALLLVAAELTSDTSGHSIYGW